MKKIMLIDDENISNFIMKRMIEKISTNCLIYEYTSPSKALNDLNQLNPDLIFLDLTMPVMDGWEFLEVMKERGCRFTVYLLTSSTSALDLEKSKNYDNLKDFLIKPLNADTLKSILNQ